MSTRRFDALLIMIAMLVTMPALANDSYIEAVSGTVRAMEDHPTIRLVAEFVHARIDTSAETVRVECVFFLENRGPSTTVTMGFPETSSGELREVVEFDSFASFVDGEPVDCTRVAGEVDEGISFAHWWTKEVEFAANQTRVVRDVYVASPGHVSTGDRYFAYTIWTGASWSGTIEAAEIVMTFEDTPAKFRVYQLTDDGRELANGCVWSFRDFEPGTDRIPRHLSIYWGEH